MDRRIAWAMGITLLTAAMATAQPPAETGYYPAAQGPVMSLPSSALFPDPVGPTGGPGGPAGPGVGYGEKPPRYPLDENGNRAINWFYSQTDLLFGWTEESSARPLGTAMDNPTPLSATSSTSIVPLRARSTVTSEAPA